MENLKVFIIKTWCSEETHATTKEIDNYLSEVCFCDDYEVISEREATAEEKQRFQEASAITSDIWLLDFYSLGKMTLEEVKKEME